MQISTFFTFRKMTGALVVLVLACALFLSLHRFFDHDEFEAVHTAWKMMQGERIYVDFANQHHPFFYYLLMPFLKNFGETTEAILWMRALMWVMYAAILWLTYLTAREVFGMETAFLSALFLGSTLLFLHKAIEIRPDVPQALFGVAAFLYLVRYFRRNKKRHLYVSAILVGVSFLFLQKALFPLLFIGAALVYSGYKRRMPYREVFFYAGVVALAVAPYLIYLVATGTLSSYLDWAWIMNLKLDVHFPPYKFIVGTLADNAPVWLFYMLGILFALKTSREKFFGAASVALFLSVFLVPAPSPQYFMAALPFVAIVSAAGLKEISCELSNTRCLTTVAAAVIVLLPLIGIAYSMTSAFSGALYNTRQLEKINYVLSLTTPGDTVYDGDIQFNVYRGDLNFIWFSVSPREGQLSTYQKWKGYRYDILELIDDKKPKVISDYTIKKILADPRISSHYAQSERYGDLYIRRD